MSKKYKKGTKVNVIQSNDGWFNGYMIGTIVKSKKGGLYDVRNDFTGYVLKDLKHENLEKC